MTCKSAVLFLRGVQGFLGMMFGVLFPPSCIGEKCQAAMVLVNGERKWIDLKFKQGRLSLREQVAKLQIHNEHGELSLSIHLSIGQSPARIEGISKRIRCLLILSEKPVTLRFLQMSQCHLRALFWVLCSALIKQFKGGSC